MTEKVKKECIESLKIMKAQGIITDIDVLGLFEKGELCISIANMVMGLPCGIILPLKDNDEYYNVYKKNIENALSRLGVEPYFVMIQNTSYGMLMSVLYVSGYEDSWEMAREDLKAKAPCAYIYNIDEDFDEVGYIKYEMFNGGPIRTA